MATMLALKGGQPVRKAMLRYATQSLDEADPRAVDEVLRSDWLTTGPAVAAFEKALCDYTGSKHAVVVNTGTAALHAASWAAGIRAGDEVIVPAISFVASANCVLWHRARERDRRGVGCLAARPVAPKAGSDSAFAAEARTEVGGLAEGRV